MRYWDTSALTELLVEQPGWEQACAWLREDDWPVTCWLSTVECWSALARLEREGRLRPEEVVAAGRRLGDLVSEGVEVPLTEEVRGRAVELLRRHPLRAADALHLASALLWAGDTPDGHEFVTFDRRLASAARAEGFVVLTAQED